MKNILPTLLLASSLTVGVGHAQLLPTGTVYESSQNAGNNGAQNLFDGSGLTTTGNPPVAGATSTGSSYASYGTIGYGAGVVNVDIDPIVAFNLGSSYTTTSLDYSQRGNGQVSTADSITGGTVYALNLTQYTLYTATLLASNDSAPASEGAAAQAPLSSLGSATFSVNGTDLSAAGGYTNFALSNSLTGQYYVVQLNGNQGPIDYFGGNPGGDELELVGTAAAVVPEPSTWALMLGGLSALAYFARRRSSV